MVKKGFQTKLLAVIIIFLVGCMGIFSINFGNFFADAYVVNLGTFQELNDGYNNLIKKFGAYQSGEEIVIDKNDVMEIDGNEFVQASDLNDSIEMTTVLSTSKNSNSEELVALDDLSDEYEITETDNNYILKDYSYTNRIIVYYEGELENYNTDYYAEGLGWHFYQYETKEDAEDAYDYYSGLDYVDSVSYDEVFTSRYVWSQDISEPAYSGYYSWGVDETGIISFNAYLDAVYSELETVYVAVFDTGVNTSHELLKDRIAYNLGKNFTEDESTTQYEFEDEDGHGSHTAGIIADQTNDNVIIVPIKVLNSEGEGTWGMLIQAYEYVEEINNDANIDANIRVINMSLGIEREDHSPINIPTLNTAIRNAKNNGIMTVVAAGNSGLDTETCSPANVSDAIVVSALSKNMILAGYSNYGSTIDFCAPGSAIISANIGNSDSYIERNGTSMAAPHVTACIALLLSSPSIAAYSNDEIEQLLREQATDLGSSGWDQYYGYGCINIGNIGLDTVGEVEFSIQGGIQEQEIELTLTYETDFDYVIYYTTDGELPTVSSTQYTGPIIVDSTVRIYAIAYIYNNGEIIQKSNATYQDYYYDGIDLDLHFTIDSSGLITAYTGPLEELNIQSYIDGKFVRTIGQFAFLDSNVKNVTLPSTCITIQNYAFYNVSTLESVSGTNVTTVGNYSFANDTNLKNVNLPRLTSLGRAAFRNCTSLESVEFDLLNEIGDNAFENDIALSLVTIPNVTDIGSSAFSGCTAISSLSFVYAEEIGDGAFNNLDLDSLTLGGAVNTFGVMTNFHADTIYTALDLNETLSAYSDNVIYNGITVEDNSPEKIVLKSSSSAELNFVVGSIYLNSEFVYYVKNNNGDYIRNLTWQNIGGIIDEENNIYQIIMQVQGLSVGSYTTYFVFSDVFGNEITTKEINILVLADSTNEFALNLSGNNYQIYIDGALVDENYILYDGIEYDVEIKANSGYEVTSVTINDVEYGSSFSIQAKSDLNINVTTSEIVEREVEFSYLDGVQIEIADEKTEFNDGDVVSFTIDLDEGYELVSVTVNDVVLQANEGVYSFEVDGNMAIDIQSRLKSFDISVSFGNGGSITNSDVQIDKNSNQTVNYGESVEYILTPVNGYEISKVLVNGESVELENNTLSLENVTDNYEIVVEFRKISDGLESNEQTLLICVCVFGGLLVALILIKIGFAFARKRRLNKINKGE